MKNFSVESLFRQKHIEGEKKDILQKVREADPVLEGGVVTEGFLAEKELALDV